MKKKRINRNQILMSIIVIAIMAMGIYLSKKNGSHPGMFAGGSFFFFLALYMFMTLKSYGILMLPLGALGYFLMMQALLGDLFSNPLLTDLNATKFYLYLDLINLLTIIGIISLIIYSLSDSIKKKKYTMFIPIGFFSLALILIGILPSILKIFI